MLPRLSPNRWVPLFVGLALVVAPHRAESQSSFVDRALQEQVDRRTRADYSLATLVPIRETLREDGVATSALQLTADRRYVIEGVCDGDCDDVDIVVRDAGGTVVASDRASDDEPVVEFVPSSSGRYVVSVVLASCSTSVCEVAANVFVRHRQPVEASRADVDRHLANVTSVLSQRGWTRAASRVVYGIAAEDDSELATFLLTAGRTYQVAGVCDEDCDDLDLTVFGPRGERLGSDAALDDVPLVSFTAPTTGAYQVRAEMESCDTPTCVFAVTVHERSGSSAASTSASASTSSSTSSRPECTVSGTRESIVVGEVRRGDLAASSCRFRDSNAVYYRLRVTTAQRITFDLTGTGMDPYLTLLDESGTQVASDDDSGGNRAARLTHSFAPGTYYVVARGLGTTLSGQYTLSARN